MGAGAGERRNDPCESHLLWVMFRALCCGASGFPQHTANTGLLWVSTRSALVSRKLCRQ